MSKLKGKAGNRVGWLVVLMVSLSGCRLLQQSQTEQLGERFNVDERVTPVDERKYTKMVVGEVEMRVEVVDTAERITLGLSYRDEIGADGMLFALPRPVVPAFWMKGMKFDLDMVWISCEREDPSTILDQADSRLAQDDSTDLNSLSVESKTKECEVVDISEGAVAPDDPEKTAGLPFYQPDAEVNYVLEVPAGWGDENGVKVGDEVVL